MTQVKLWRPPPSWAAGSWKAQEWIFLNAAFAHIKASGVGSIELAAADLHEHLRAGLRSALRLVLGPRTEERFMLKPEFWRRVALLS